MKLCHMMGHKVGMITYIQIVGGLTSKIWEGQNVENLARFWTTCEFERDYFRNGSRYKKCATNLIEIDPCQCWVQPKNGELWSTNKKVTGTDVELL